MQLENNNTSRESMHTERHAFLVEIEIKLEFLKILNTPCPPPLLNLWKMPRCQKYSFQLHVEVRCWTSTYSGKIISSKMIDININLCHVWLSEVDFSGGAFLMLETFMIRPTYKKSGVRLKRSVINPVKEERACTSNTLLCGIVYIKWDKNFVSNVYCETGRNSVLTSLTPLWYGIVTLPLRFETSPFGNFRRF